MSRTQRQHTAKSQATQDALLAGDQKVVDKIVKQIAAQDGDDQQQPQFIMDTVQALTDWQTKNDPNHKHTGIQQVIDNGTMLLALMSADEDDDGNLGGYDS